MRLRDIHVLALELSLPTRVGEELKFMCPNDSPRMALLRWDGELGFIFGDSSCWCEFSREKAWSLDDFPNVEFLDAELSAPQASLS